MKKIYTLLVLALLAVVSAKAADEITFKLVIDDASRVKVTTYSGGEIAVVTGENELTCENWETVKIEPSSDEYYIKSVTNATGVPQEIRYGACSLTVRNYWVDEVFTVTSGVIADMPQCSFTIEVVGDPEKVNAQLYGSLGGYKPLDLVEGVNTVNYADGYYSQLTISPVGGTPYYMVKLNGEEQTSDWQFDFDLLNGMEVYIEPEFPDIDCTISFTYEDATDCISSVQIDGEALSDFDGTSFTCKAGSDVTIYFNSTDYKIETLKVNGVETSLSYYGSLNFYAKGDTEINVTAAPYGTMDIVFNVNYADGVKLYKGYYSDEDNRIPLVNGKNVITLSETVSVLSYSIDKSAYYFVSMTRDDQELDSWTTYLYNIADGVEFNLELGKYVIDKQAVVWVDALGQNSYTSFQNTNRATYNLVDGYNPIDFAAEFNPFMMNWYTYSETATKAYLNNEELSLMYGDGKSNGIQTEFADGDVLKVFFTTVPEECGVQFEYDPGVDVEIYHDLIVKMEQPATGLQCLTGTQIDITPVGESLTGVTVNDESVAINDNGVYSFVVEGNSNVKLSGGGSGISSVAADKAVNSDVYNLQGIKVGSRDELRTLPAGLYIVGGEKVLVK